MAMMLYSLPLQDIKIIKVFIFEMDIIATQNKSNIVRKLCDEQKSKKIWGKTLSQTEILIF